MAQGKFKLDGEAYSPANLVPCGNEFYQKDDSEFEFCEGMEMVDYSRYKTETLKKMCDTAYADYYKAAVQPCGDGRNFSKSPEARKLARLTKRYEAICVELEKRAAAENKCISCVHNTGIDVMNCECACSGITEVRDEGRIVVSCGDYKKKGRSVE